MKKYTHPIKKLTHIQFKNGSSFKKYWVYFRASIQDGGSYFSITKIKSNFTETKKHSYTKDIKNMLITKKEENDILYEIMKIKNNFN